MAEPPASADPAEPTAAPPTDAPDDGATPDDETAPEAPPRSALLQAVEAPISADAPTGIKVRYEDSFQNLKAEIDKIGSASGNADYDRIVELGQSILTSQSKDLTVAYYLALGLMRTQGHGGLAESIGVVHVLTDTFWDGLHPKKTSARGNILQLLAERVTAHLEERKPAPDDRPALERVQGDLEALQAFYLEHMGDKAPALSRVVRIVKDTLRKIPKPEPPKPKTPKPEPTAAGEASSAGSAPASKPTGTARSDGNGARPSATASLSADFASTSDASVLVLKAAAFLRDEDLTSPLPYLLTRAARWGALKQAPPKLANAPLDKRRSYLEGLLAKGEYLALVENGERDFQNPPFYFWLDLQRLVASALQQLGPAYSQAHKAVEGAAVRLVRRLPSLSTLSFADGVPVADPLTTEWLADLSSAGADGSSAAASGSGEIEAAYEEARQTLTGGDLKAALQTLSQAPTDGAVRAQFVRDLYAADLCFKGKAVDVALPLLDHLTHLMDAHALRTWEPSLASRCLALRHACLKQLLATAPAPEKADLQDRAKAAFAELCAIDPAYGLAQMT